MGKTSKLVKDMGNCYWGVQMQTWSRDDGEKCTPEFVKVVEEFLSRVEVCPANSSR